MSGGVWEVPAPSTEPATPGERGTHIAITRVAHRLPDYDRLAREIGYAYSPAIKQGRQITIQRAEKGSLPTPVQRYELPRFDGPHIDVRDTVNGKSIRVYAGVVPANVYNERPGLSYVHRFRVIIRNSGAGCGSYDVSLIAGFVELGDDWVLTKNKDGLARDEHALHETVLRHMRPLLERAGQATHLLESDALRDAVEADLNDLLFGNPDPKERAKRNAADGAGTVKPTGTGGKHKRARETQPGTTFGGCRASGVAIRFVPGFRDGGPIGDVIPGKTVTVRLHEDHPFVASAMGAKDRRTIALLATTLLASMRAMREGRQTKMYFAETVPDSAMRLWCELGKFAHTSLAMDGRRIVSDETRTDAA